MLKLLPLFAAATRPLGNTPAPLHEGKPSNLGSFLTRDVVLICGAAIAMGLVLFLWAYLTRKDRQKQHAAVRGARILTKVERHASEQHGQRTRVRKRRKEHPDNWGRNPTLAEAGGLPPLREDNPPMPMTAPATPPANPPQPQAPT